MSAVSVHNPLLDEYMEVSRGHDPEGFDLDKSLAIHAKRDECTVKYAWAVPNDAALEALIQLSPLVEIGAGLGYWAHLLEQMGGDVVAYDKHVGDGGEVKLYNRDSYVMPYTRVVCGGPEAAALHPDRALFLCWPPYGEPMAGDALQNYLESGGMRVAYVGEGAGGCTADDDFHELLDSRMVLVSEVAIPTWWCIHDRLEIWHTK